MTLAKPRISLLHSASITIFGHTMATQRWRAASSRFRVRPVAFLALAACTAVAPVAEAANRKMTVTNTCPYTLWMAYFTVKLAFFFWRTASVRDADQRMHTRTQSVGPQPSQKTGWESPSGTTLTFEVEESWGGRIWARTNCGQSSSLARCSMVLFATDVFGAQISRATNLTICSASE